jgi:8-oxo-dGTP pyrophosphatase MutT (NUDIX family)
MAATPRFDPRTVPIHRVDHDLPRVPAQALRPQAIAQRFAQPPDWEPELRREPRFMDRPPASAAVLVPLVLRDGLPSVLLTERAGHLRTHSGQIAFPGGKVDADDASVRHAALREAQEEIGLDPEHVQVLGELPVYVTGTAFQVTPVVALVSPAMVLQPNPGEVADVFEVPLDFLMNPAHHRWHAFEWEGQRRHWCSMPYLESRAGADGQTQCVERYIWGATAGMLRNFYRFLISPTSTVAP